MEEGELVNQNHFNARKRFARGEARTPDVSVTSSAANQ